MVFFENSPQSISLQSTIKIKEQMEACIFKIFVTNLGLIGTGFFCLIPFQNKNLPVMITNNHVLNEETLKKEQFIPIELNNLNIRIQINDNRKIYTNKKYDITIIEIIPEKDNIFNFLELDEEITFIRDIEYFELHLKRSSIYLLYSAQSLLVSYGILRNINEERIFHFCNTGEYSSGAPILNLSKNKVIGIHVGAKSKYNIGTLLKYSINEFINLHKDYIISNGVCSENNINKININNINTSGKVFDKPKKNLEEEIKQEKEKIKKLEEKINQLNDLLKKNDNNRNSINNNQNNINVNVGNPNDLLQSIIKKDKIIEDLRLKLSRFSFELSEGEKLISIIFTSTDQKIHYSIICKNTDIFYNLELKLYQKYNELSDLENYFTVNGRRVNKTKNLEFNKIKDNDVIILNTLDI